MAEMLKNKNNHWYAEISLAPEYILTKYHKVVPITNKEKIQRILGNSTLNPNKTGLYSRNIGGIGIHTKRLYGNPINSFVKSRL